MATQALERPWFRPLVRCTMADGLGRGRGQALPSGSAGTQRLRGALAGVVVVLIWSGWITLSRYGATGGLTIYDMTALRFGTAALVTIPLWPRYAWHRVQWGRALIVSLGCGFPYVLLTFAGLRTTGAAGAGVIVNGSLPIASAVLGVLWMKRHPRRAVWATAIAVLGANCCMLGESKVSAAGLSASALGVVCLLGAAFVLTAYMVAVEAWRFGIGDVLVLVPLINAALFVPVWWLALPSLLRSASFSQIAVQAAYQGLVVSVLALVLFTECVKQLGALSSALFMAFVPACTAALAWWLLGEALTSWQLCGIGLCSAALVYYAASAPSRTVLAAAAPSGSPQQ
jgi:drug/metabolite transporter (DMT)-like permease